MESPAYTTADYQNELTRVRKARRRNTIIVLATDAVIICAAIAYVMTGFSF